MEEKKNYLLKRLWEKSKESFLGSVDLDLRWFWVDDNLLQGQICNSQICESPLTLYEKLENLTGGFTKIKYTIQVLLNNTMITEKETALKKDIHWTCD